MLEKALGVLKEWSLLNSKSKNEVIKKKNNRNRVEIQKFIIFVKKNLKINMLKIKIAVKLGTIVIIQGNAEVLNITFAI